MSIKVEEVWDSLQYDHTPVALKVWSDFLKEQGENRDAEMLLFYAKAGKWPNIWGKVYSWSWFLANPTREVMPDDLDRADFDLLSLGVFSYPHQCRDYVCIKDALQDFYRAMQVCRTCKGLQVIREITYTPQPGKTCTSCKGSGKRKI